MGVRATMNDYLLWGAGAVLVLLIALLLNLFFAYTRWSRIAHYPQAFPAGRLAR